ncbi:MAG: hypothetical protein HY897_01125 [Deltaproteobacteria bacterium]|nr:hypothetical protein [Deltaproteobacteria bacterium]
MNRKHGVRTIALVAALRLLAACGGRDVELREPGLIDGDVIKPDGDGPAGAPLVPCIGDENDIIQTEDYGCGYCGADGFYAVVCRNGYLGCAGYARPDAYIVDMADWSHMTGQCASIAVYFLPGFMLTDPWILETYRKPTSRIRLWAHSMVAKSNFEWMNADRAAGEAAIRALVKVQDMTAGKEVVYDIGDPKPGYDGSLSEIHLNPAAGFEGNRWYRVTLLPGDSQVFMDLHVFGSRSPLKWLDAPETTDFYTYSRPMIRDMRVRRDETGNRTVEFNLTEPLSWSDVGIDSRPVAVLDGVELKGCLHPLCYPAGIPDQFESMWAELPSEGSFHMIELRMPGNARSINGGALKDGAAENPHATVSGEWVVYSFNAEEMVRDPDSDKTWYYSGE